MSLDEGRLTVRHPQVLPRREFLWAGAAADSDSTKVTDAFSVLCARVLRNTYTTDYRHSDAPVLTGYVQSVASRDVIRAAVETRNREYYPLWAGQGVGMVKDVPAGDVLTSIVNETFEVLQEMRTRM